MQTNRVVTDMRQNTAVSAAGNGSGLASGKNAEAAAASVKNRWVQLAAGSMGMLLAGIIYAWSILKVPLAENFGWAGSQLALNYTITMCFFCVGSLAAGMLVKKIPVRMLLTGAGLLLFGGFLIVSRLQGGNIGILYLSYGFMAGLGIGIAYNTLLSTASAWYPDQKGTCSGTLMMCFGLSTLVLGQIASRLFALPSFGWRKTFILFGIVILAIFSVCGIIMKRPAPGTVLPKAAAKGAADESFEQRDYSTAEVVRRPTFWIFYIYGTLGATVGSVVISFARELALSLGAAVATATLLVGILSVFNGVGRILCGITFDRLGRKKTMFIVSLVTILAPALMMFAVLQHSLLLGILGFCFTGVSYSCFPTISSAFISTFYGTKDFPMNYSISNTKMLISSFAATAASSLLASTGSYFAPFAMLLCFAGISFGLLFLIRKP